MYMPIMNTSKRHVVVIMAGLIMFMLITTLAQGPPDEPLDSVHLKPHPKDEPRTAVPSENVGAVHFPPSGPPHTRD